MHHFPPRAAPFGSARDQHGLPVVELLAQVGLIEPHGAQILIVLADQHAEQRLAHAAVNQVRFLDRPQHAHQRAFFQGLDRAQIGEVLIIAGKEEQQVAHRAHVQLCQKFRPRAAAPFEELHGRGKSEDGMVRRQLTAVGLPTIGHPTIVEDRQATASNHRPAPLLSVAGPIACRLSDTSDRRPRPVRRSGRFRDVRYGRPRGCR